MREDAAQAAPSQRRQQGVPGGGGTPPGALTPRGPPPLLPDGSAKGDDELTSLSWLQDTNLLRKLAGPPAASSAGGANHEGNGTASGRSSANAMSASASPGEEDDSREWGPPGQVPYNPQVHVTSKPPYSFSCLIFMAIEESAGKALPVKDIYAWILGHFPYFQRAPTGWKNSVRHNLSLNKCFRKVDKDKGQNIGKGSLWCIDPEFRPNLLQAMRKTPCFPYTQLNWASPTPHIVPSSQQDNGDQALSADPSQAQNNVPSPMLFPFLSKRLAASSTKDQDVDAAATMLALQNGPSIHLPPSDDEDDEEEEGYRDSPPSPIVFTKKHLRLRQRATSEFIRTPPATNSTVITTSPSEDHTYSASLANGGGGDSDDGTGIAITAIRSLAPALSPPPEEDNPPEENSNSSSSGGGMGGLGRLPLSSVPPRKRRAALAAAAALPRKSRRTSTSTTRRSSNGSAAALSSDHAQDMAEGAAHALLNLAKVATSQQQLLLQSNNNNNKTSSPAIRERR